MCHILASQLIYFSAKHYMFLHVNPREKMLLLYACISVVQIIWSILIVSGSGWELLSSTLTQRRNVFSQHLKINVKSLLFFALIHN